MEVEGSPHDRSGGASLGTISFLLAVTAAVIYALSLLLIGFIVLFPRRVPDDAPLLAVLGIAGPPASLALGVLASLLGLVCILLKRRDRSHAAAALLIGALLMALTGVFTLQPWEVLRPVLQN